ncbi:tubulin-folding cofactor B-like [Anneissia japonica]|uniref:tubulin-folding cofactor B-like n=1 Tax=Anneissia japonica TaxID=1529436 RepID=UPI00142598D2|nr:tubulin-folding cofactor B-like [Anneissia japonica]
MSFTVVTQDLVDVAISSSLNSFGSRRRFQKDITVSELKGKLEMIVGSSSAFMELQLFDENNKMVTSMADDAALLGSFPIDDNMRIHVIDKDPNRTVGEYEDVSKVEKFEITAQEYEARSDSVRAFKKRNKLGKFADKDPEEEKRKEEENKKKEIEEETLAKTITVGSRCEVNNPKVPPVKRGTVRFVGKTDFKPGWWVGIQYDEPYGKNNGSVGGKQYFECPDKYGGFIKPNFVKVGDYPVEDDMDEM